MAMESIQRFVQDLQVCRSSDIVHNQYSEEKLANNLEIYLQRMQFLKPSLLLVGEAPGYRGCAITGIPFTDEVHMMTKDSQHSVLGERWGYQRMKLHDAPEKENSATIIWNILDQSRNIPLMWNIYPFHPHKEEDHSSNRTPSIVEIKTNSIFLVKLMSIFPSIEKIYAIGRKAEKRLFELCDNEGQFLKNNYGLDYIRHPSHGGKMECECGLCEALGVELKC